MAKLAELQQLIQSLSKSEKRHFRLASQGQDSQPIYLRLFDFYAQNPTADSELVKRRCKLPPHQQLSVLNTYLYQRILSSLKSLHQRSSVDFQIREYLQQAEVLFDKELIRQTEIALRQAEALAQKYHRHALLCDVYQLQRKLILTRDGPVKGAKALAAWADKQQTNLQYLQEVHPLWLTLIDLGRGVRVSDKAHAISNLQASDNIQANILRLHIKYAHHIMSNELETGLAAIGELIDLLERHPLLIADDPNGYVTTINNKISLLLLIDNKQEAPELFARLHRLQERFKIRRSNPSLNRQLLRSYNIELEFLRERMAIDAGLAQIDDINEFLRKNKDIVPDEYYLMIYYQFAFFTFAAARYRQAQQWVSQINRYTPLLLRPDIRAQAKLLNLCLLFQFDQLNTLKYAVDNTRRFIKKQNLQTPSNQTLLKIFSRLSLAQAGQTPAILAQATQELTQLETSPEIQVYLAWLQRQRV